ncbi:MAG: RluA family pseudouridine synthase [Alphaproteobacteria bacterium]|nr:RluA family pseudouridine synthase [Alphaproteobacteria bacterium]
MKVESVTIAETDAGQRLDRWLRRRFPGLTQGRIEKLLRTGQLRLDGKRAKASDRIAAGQIVRLPPLDLAPKEDRPQDVSEADARMLRDAVLHRDDDVIVLNKPPGIPVQGGTGQGRHIDGMLDALRFDAADKPRLVHRLDKDTSGVLVLARGRHAAQFLTGAFKSKKTRKIYWALVVGIPPFERGRIAVPLAKIPTERGESVAADEEGGKEAITWYRTIERLGKMATWLAMMPVTGRTHQLRVHAAEMGTPVAGDAKYGGDRGLLTGQISRKLHLHARALEIPHPKGGMLRVIAPLPSHMAATWRLLGLDPDDARDPFADFADLRP